MATNGKVALKSNNPPGPLISELEINIERFDRIRNFTKTIAAVPISAKTGETLSFEELMSDLNRVRIIYIGERHNDPVHHTVQLKLIKALYKKHHNIAVGMEAFDRSYRKILDQWTAGSLDEQSFIEKSHWYANWRFDFKCLSQRNDDD